MKIRLHQFLSKSGIFTSKAKVKESIWEGKITINGVIIKNMSYEFNPNKKKVIYDNKIIKLPQKESYFLLNKPLGFICSRLNSQEVKLAKKSVYELFRDETSATVYKSLITVGRLDENTTGFLLVTTDGKLVHKITNPENNIKKTYYIETTESITKEQINSIKNGVQISVKDNGVIVEEYITRPAILSNIKEFSMEITIDEGKKREIRRMLTSLGNEVKKLHRLSTENMLLSDFNIDFGEYCEIDIREINVNIFNNIESDR